MKQQCKFDPKSYKKKHGWFDCPYCGLPVKAGYPHPEATYKEIDGKNICETCDVFNSPNCTFCLGS